MKKTILAIMIIFIALFMFAVPNCTLAATLETADATFEINRTITNVDQEVTNDFTYTFTPAADNPSVVTIPDATVKFEGVEPDANYIATSTASVDLSSINFDKLGNYNFTISETASTDSTNYPVDSTNTYTLLVEVRNEVDENGVPTGNLIATKHLIDNATDTKISADSTGSSVKLPFTQDAGRTEVSLTKTVSGDLADTSKYFEFKVTVEGVTGEEFAVAGGSSDQNPTVVVANTPVSIYVKSGETITIGNEQIRFGSTYSFTEVDSGEGYTTNITLGDGTVKEETLETGELTADSDSAKNKVTFENVKESSTLTGVILNIAPYVLMIVVAVLLIVVFKKILSVSP